MMSTKVVFAPLLAISLVLAGPASDRDRAWAQSQPEQAEPALYRIGPADVLDISVWNNTALSRTVPVRPDGKISLPLLNDVQAAGLTPVQLREALAEKLVAYLPTPEVSVIVREVQSFRVSVIGEVRRPDRYDLRGRGTVLDALAMAGGFAEFAARTRIVILRHDGATAKRIPFNYNAIVSANGANGNFFLEPGDIILVP